MANKNRRNQKKTKAKTVKQVHQETTPASTHKTIDGVFLISQNSLKVLLHNKKLFGGIMLIYCIVYLIFIEGLSNLPSSASFSTSTSKFLSGFSTFGMILGGSSNSSNPSSSAYQAFLIVTVSLVLIWTLRQVYNGNKVRIRDGYYKALYPFIPFILILLFIGLQLLPLIIGSTLYSVVISQGIASNAFEKGFALVFLLGLIILSLYFLSSSVFALYVVTLPDMTPVKALKSAKGLVKGRRALIMRKLIFLPVALVIGSSILVFPFILIYPPLAAWLIFILTALIIAVTHSYLYNLYRELIK